MRWRPSLWSLLACLAPFAGLASNAHAIAVVDGSFESPAYAAGGFSYHPSPPGWTFSAGAGIAHTGSPWFAGTPPDGTQAAYLQGYTAWSGTISQTLSGFSIGQSYTVQFYMAQRPGYQADPFNVLLGGTVLGAYAPTTTGFMQQITAAWVATATSATLTFTDPGLYGGDRDTAIDNVTVQSVPEPASAALLSLGLLALGRIRRLT